MDNRFIAIKANEYCEGAGIKAPVLTSDSTLSVLVDWLSKTRAYWNIEAFPRDADDAWGYVYEAVPGLSALHDHVSIN